MLVPDSVFNLLPILDLQTGQSIAELSLPIIDPNHLQLVAFYVKGKFFDKNSILHTSDIREYTPDGVIVDSADSIMPFTDDLVRLQDVASLNFKLVDKQVLDEHHRKLGKVESYICDSANFRIMQFRVRQSLRKNLQEDSLLIHRQQIIELTDKFIVVKAPDVRVRSANPVTSLIPQILPKASDIRSNFDNDN